MKIIYYNYAAFAILALIIATAFIRNVGNTRANRSFMISVCEITLTTAFQIWAVNLDNAGPGNVFGKYISHGGYLYFHTLTSLFYLFYLISLTDTWHKFKKDKVRQVLLCLPAIIFTVVFFLQFFLPLKTYYVNEAGSYTRGQLFFLNYIIAGIYIFYGLVYIVRFRQLFSTRWIITMFSPFPFIFVAMAIELLFPQFNIEMFFNALAVLFIFINIQKPEETMDETTGINNMLSFETYCKRAFYNNKAFTILLVELSNYDSIKEMLDYESNKKIRRGIAKYLEEVNKEMGLQGQLYYARQGRYFMVCEDVSDLLVDQAGEYIYNTIKDSEEFKKMRITPKASVCIMTAPGDFSDFDTFMRFCNRALFITGEISLAKDLLADKNYAIKINLEKIISDAIDYGRLEVYYQPIYSFDDKRFISAEALIRLKDPEFGFISPELFIPHAEKSGEINRIWDFVIKSVCEFISSKEFEDLGIQYIEVNLSAVQCVQENLAENILKTIEGYNIHRGKISLEITETALVYGEDMLAMNLGKLRDAGMLICLDDYGTGYSNTRRIMDLPLSIVKLDKSFMNGLETDSVQRIIWNTVNMIKAENMHIVAEGVETERALHELKLCGVDLIQGYYFSKPLPKADFITRVKTPLKETEII